MSSSYCLNYEAVEENNLTGQTAIGRKPLLRLLGEGDGDFWGQELLPHPPMEVLVAQCVCGGVVCNSERQVQ